MNAAPAGAGSGNTNIWNARLIATQSVSCGERRRPALRRDDVGDGRRDRRERRAPERPVDEEPRQRLEVVDEVHRPERAAERGRDAGPGRLAAGPAFGTAAVDPALVAPAVATAASPLVTAACSARLRRRASVRSVRLARANGAPPVRRAGRGMGAAAAAWYPGTRVAVSDR